MRAVRGILSSRSKLVAPGGDLSHRHQAAARRGWLDGRLGCLRLARCLTLFRAILLRIEAAMLVSCLFFLPF